MPINHSAEQDQLDRGFGKQRIQHTQIRGDDPQRPTAQMPRQVEHGRAHIQQERLAVVDERRGSGTDAALLGCVAQNVLGEGGRRPRRQGQCAAMHARQLTFAGERLEVTPDGHARHPQLRGQAGHRIGLARANIRCDSGE